MGGREGGRKRGREGGKEGGKKGGREGKREEVRKGERGVREGWIEEGGRLCTSHLYSRSRLNEVVHRRWREIADMVQISPGVRLPAGERGGREKRRRKELQSCIHVGDRNSLPQNMYYTLHTVHLHVTLQTQTKVTKLWDSNQTV